MTQSRPLRHPAGSLWTGWLALGGWLLAILLILVPPGWLGQEASPGRGRLAGPQVDYFHKFDFLGSLADIKHLARFQKV